MPQTNIDETLQCAIENGTLPLITIVGPTASGKTHRAVSLAKLLNAEIISGDSRQVYTGMDLGTGKDIEEYGDVSVHLIDIRPAGYKYNLHEFIHDFEDAETSIRSRGKNIILCGGTGLYVESILSGIKLPPVPENSELRNSLRNKSLEELTSILASMKHLHNITDIDTVARAIRAIEIQSYYAHNPQLAAQVDKNNAQRRDSLIILVDIPRDDRRQRISQRLDSRLMAGMEQEVQHLMQSGIEAEDLEYYGLEYKYVTQAITGKITHEEMHHNLEIAIHQFAKRQMTWYRGMQRRGYTLNPIQWNLPDDTFNFQVLTLLSTHINSSS
ncbi:MAG: tRNA (adenosine(37)-N6)-dimethylallyltransferase MiaA [Muribaculaceae bacterium]|nr:tRNA (adenosine(37)-N6)-dimethylallyltransferase MiaA [Muribaculaceae bacterium]